MAFAQAACHDSGLHKTIAQAVCCNSAQCRVWAQAACRDSGLRRTIALSTCCSSAQCRLHVATVTTVVCITKLWFSPSLQRSWRRFRAASRHRAAVMIQAAWRGSRQRTEFLRRRACVKKVQALVRGHSARRRYSQNPSAAPGKRTVRPCLDPVWPSLDPV